MQFNKGNTCITLANESLKYISNLIAEMKGGSNNMQKVLPMSYYYISNQKQKKGYAAAKRIMDVFFSLIALILFLPLGLFVALISALDTKGSPIFVQERMGRNNRPFKMFKFRTMSVDAPPNVATHQLNDAESYISRIGGLLRKLSLDELPQLLNILKGDMSFVGPRPVVLTEEALLQMRTLNKACTVRPGLTGWAQVNGRDDVKVVDKAKMDAYYARHISFSMDVRILFRTVGYVLGSRGIHEGANPAITADMKKSEQSA